MPGAAADRCRQRRHRRFRKHRAGRTVRRRRRARHDATRRAAPLDGGAAERRDTTARIDDRRGAERERAPQRQRKRPSQHRLYRPERDAEQQHAEHHLHFDHPGAGARQQRPGRGADEQERHAHAGGEREQRRAAEPDIARLAEVEQGTGQRRGDAGADDQRRDAAHGADAGDAAAGQALRRLADARGQRLRQLQLVDAEHRQRQGDQADREGTQHPGVLQRRREAFAGEPGGDAKRGIDDRHAEGIRGGQGEAPPARNRRRPGRHCTASCQRRRAQRRRRSHPDRR